jgi:hypothetical protein
MPAQTISELNGMGILCRGMSARTAIAKEIHLRITKYATGGGSFDDVAQRRAAETAVAMADALLEELAK